MIDFGLRQFVLRQPYPRRSAIRVLTKKSVEYKKLLNIIRNY